MGFTRSGTPAHSQTTGRTATDHHTATVAGDLQLSGLAGRAHSDLSDAPTAAHHTATVAGDLQLSGLAGRAHGDLSDAPVSAHHPDSTLSTITSEAQSGGTASGDQSYTGAGFVPSAVLIIAHGTDNDDSLSWGYGDDAAGQSVVHVRSLSGTPVMSSNTTNIIEVTNGAGSTSQKALLKSLDADGITLTWTKGGAGEAGTFIILYLR